MACVKNIENAIKESQSVLQAMQEDVDLHDATVKAIDVCVQTLKKGNKILFCGNGGSAADAQHWAGELVSRFYYDRPGLAAIALTTDTSILTAIGNDYGYERSFSRQIDALGREGDVLVAISTSGNSLNIIKALEKAHEKKLKTIGFTGHSGGKMLQLCDVCLRIPSNSTPRIQEGHEVLGHTVCAYIEAEIFPKADRE
ncbi:D-sedoheptulose-7-phosphate isomerase [Bartonella apis]|uniref:D-sedoheptulose-7-phosphate isomerase n=1 Tax=Bartonella apis TaxID=1686310 RepID=UPI00242ED898|nr:D-sedoheptulose 7-phosphate isomerase [Bartonella apis]